MNNPADGSDGGSTPFVITLMSSTAPMALQAPEGEGLAGLAVFRSRRREDNRDRYRLHLGYFSSMESAEQLLPIVRESYPAAFVAVAPDSGMGSLDDTGMARFSIIKPIEAPPAPARVPDARPPDLTAEPVLRFASEPLKPAPAKPVAAPQVAATAAPGRLVEAPPAAPEVTEPEPEKPAQQYAVQLLWSKQIIDLSKIPSLSIFAGYLLYAVETERGGRRMYGVRLGFYTDTMSAGLVAQYIRPQFPGATTVPVSERERERASTAVIRLTSGQSRRSSRQLIRWPQSALAVDSAQRTSSL